MWSVWLWSCRHDEKWEINWSLVLGHSSLRNQRQWAQRSERSADLFSPTTFNPLIQTPEQKHQSIKALLFWCEVWRWPFCLFGHKASVILLILVSYLFWESQKNKCMIVTDRFCTSLLLLPCWHCRINYTLLALFFRFSKKENKPHSLFLPLFYICFLHTFTLGVVWYCVGLLHVHEYTFAEKRLALFDRLRFIWANEMFCVKYKSRADKEK